MAAGQERRAFKAGAAEPSPGWIAAPLGLGFDAPNPNIMKEGRKHRAYC